MSEYTELILIRHGETEWNLTGRWQGHADSPLSSRGVDQARLLAKKMITEPIDAVYVSDLERAQSTAKLAGQSSGWSPIAMEELRERDLGVLEGLTTEEMLVEQPSVYHSFIENNPSYQPPGGESFCQFFDRCSAAVEKICDQHPGEKIVAVTHGGVLGAVFRYILKLPLDAERNFVLLNCSINRLRRFSDGKWELISWGDVSHLNELESLDDG